ERLRQAPGPSAPLAVERAEVRGGLLHHLPPAPHRAHHPPVRVRPAPLPHHRVPQVHRTPPRTVAIARNRKARKGSELALHVDFAPRRREIHVLSAAAPAEKFFRCPNWRSQASRTLKNRHVGRGDGGEVSVSHSPARYGRLL